MTRVAVIVLAAGRGTRFGSGQTDHKLNAPYRGAPLVRRVVETVLRSQAEPVVVVTGHAHDRVNTALNGLEILIVQNPDYASGLASSIRTGIAALGSGIDGALMMLADMPLVTTNTLDALVARFAAKSAIDAVVPTFDGNHGNPVLVARGLFQRLETLCGDDGARRILVGPDLSIEYCEVFDRGILIDVDTRADLAALEERLQEHS